MPARDQIIVIDLEATCWEDRHATSKDAEIIEIGVCLLNKLTLEITQKTSILVQPTRSEISPFCTQLTTLRKEDFDDAVSLADACRVLEQSFLSKERQWASWGDWDRVMIERETKDRNILYPMGRTHFNVKALFNLLSGQKEMKSLTEAMKHLDLPFEGTLHRGHDDAYAIATVFKNIIANQRKSK